MACRCHNVVRASTKPMSTRRRKTKSFAAQAFELGIAAPQVIAHRMARMARASPPRSALNSAEFRRMGTEKIAAINEAWTAMVTQAILENQRFALRFMQSLWWPWMRPTFTMKGVPRQLGRAAESILGKGMAPVHRRAVANARRLGRKKRK